MEKRKARMVGRYLKKRSVEKLSEEEIAKLSNDIKGDNSRIVGMGTFTVPASLLKKASKAKSPDKYKDELYKDWVRYSAGFKTGDEKPLDSREVFDLHFDQFLAWTKQKELEDLNRKFKDFIKDTKGKKGRAAITALKGCLRWAVGQSPKITAGQLITLLSVAENEYQTLAYYCDVTKQQKSTVSRHMLEMGGTTDKYVGLDWIKMEDHPTDGRAKLFSLTEKGHQFIGHIEEQMSMPYEESNLLSSVLGIPIQASAKITSSASAKATVITKEDREREAKKAEVAAKYKFLNS